MCNTKIIQVFSMDLHWNTLIEYLMLYLAPVPVMRLLDAMQEGRIQVAWKKWVLRGVTAVLTIFFVVAFILQMTN